MSYLHPLRLHFSGSFQAAISTVNNDPVHFDNATFEPSYQEVQAGNDVSQWNGWFSPRGSGDWRLRGCTVTSAFMADGHPASPDDPILDAIVADSDSAVSAKLVDLDPEQQLVSMIWGLEVRVATSAGNTMMRGKFAPVAFMDIWDRSQRPGAMGDFNASAMYQSVLTDLDWAGTASSPFVSQLKAAADGIVSIKFNVDGINLDPESPNFLTGRIVGTIGPATTDEPRHFVLGRQFMTPPSPAPGANFFIPAGNINFCVAAIDHATSRVYLDLGNALPTLEPGGPLANLGDLALYVASPDPTQPPSLVGSVPSASYTASSWYPSTAGVVTLPADRSLTAEELAGLSGNPLSIVATPAGGTAPSVISEPPSGVFTRADQFVYRLNPGDEELVRIYATRFGNPYPGAGVITIQVPEQLQPFSPLGTAPPVATPQEAIHYETRILADRRGVAELHIQARDPGQPRGYIDGQVYAICPVLEETVISPAAPYPYNQWNYVSILLWSRFQPDEPPTWFGSIQLILQQYANLYPVMQRFLDLGSYESVCENVRFLTMAFGLDPSNPNSMPVTRDLSAAKRAAILRWLTETGEDGKPRQGTAAQAAARVAEVPRPELPSLPPGARTIAPPSQGGKASAASRRLISQRPSTADPLTWLARGGGQ
jgi:hypothetical protein